MKRILLMLLCLIAANAFANAHVKSQNQNGDNPTTDKQSTVTIINVDKNQPAATQPVVQNPKK